MEYCAAGKSGVKVSRLGLGAMGFGDRVVAILGAGPGTEPRDFPPCDRAGINFIDTCDYYSAGASEEIVGRLVAEVGNRAELVIATKVGNPMGRDANARGYSRKHIIEAAEASLRRLRTDYIDVYQTHIWDPATDLEEMVEAFDHLVRPARCCTSASPTCRSGSSPLRISMPSDMGWRSSHPCRTITICSGVRMSASCCRSAGRKGLG